MTASDSEFAASIGRRAGLARRLASAALPIPERGRLTIVLPDGDTISLFGECAGPEASIALNRWRGLWRVLIEGDIGFAQGWIDGDWSSSDLDAVLAFALENESAFAATSKGWRIAAVLNRMRHFRNSNTRRRSRRNISAHYDLGNAFYSQWLDREMNYSSALYRTCKEKLEEAQEAKLDRVVELLGLSGGEDVLEIGCGWGALAARLAWGGVGSVTGITLSREQLAFARARIGSVTPVPVEMRLQDYRDCNGRFDRIVSIEMVEAVGSKYWPTYFAKLRHALKPGGSAVLQAITIAEEHFENYRNVPDFIQRYIFPGGMLPTKNVIRDQAAQVGLKLVYHESFGISYAHTLRVWRDRFISAWPGIANLGFDERFRRMWIYYLAYCELGFRNGRLDVGLFKLLPR